MRLWNNPYAAPEARQPKQPKQRVRSEAKSPAGSKIRLPLIRKPVRGTGGKRGALQELHGILDRTENGIRTIAGELLLFRVSPSNLSVLSDEATEEKIRGLTLLLEAEPNLEMLCVDAVENLSANKRFLDERIREETNPRVLDMLKKDRAFFSALEEGGREGLAPSRDFFFLLRIPRLSQAERQMGVPERARAFTRTAAGCGLTVRPVSPEETEELLTRFFGIPNRSGKSREETDAESDPKAKPFLPGGTGNAEIPSDVRPFADRITPTGMQFFSDRYLLGESVRCVWALRAYPPATVEQGLLSGLGDREGVTVHIYLRPVSPSERNRLLQSAERQNRWKSASRHLQESVDGQENMKDLSALLSDRKQDNGSLLTCAVFLELSAPDERALSDLKNAVQTELTRCRITHDPLILRQAEGFQSVLPCGSDRFKEEFERVLPASSVANLYPFRYSGKTDPRGLYLGRDKYGTNLFVDPDRRDADKTNGNILILGNSGQGKSYLLKLLLINARESGKRVIVVDPEGEYREVTQALGGVYVDLLDGVNRINPLEVRDWTEDPNDEENGGDADGKARNENRLAGHISFLKDFFRTYREFPEEQMDVIELLLSDLYAEHAAGEAPTLEDLYRKAEEACGTLRRRGKAKSASGREAETLYPETLLRDLCLSLRSLCVGAESRFFNGKTVLADQELVCVGLKGIHACNRRLKDAVLFNLFSYLHHRLVTDGNTVAILDELYLFLTNPVVLDYLRSAMKRVRKRNSALWLSSQNIEDFLLPGIREYTIPLFSIPTHQFLFYPGNVSPAAFTDTLQLEPSAFAQIRTPERGTCLYRCGNERYLLQVHAPAYKTF